MDLAGLALRQRTTTLVLTGLLLFGGFAAFRELPRLEDPEFTIKEALVITPYPGASAREVEEEVSDKIERAVQQLGQLKEVESKSDRGLSTVTVRIQDRYDRSALPQVWDELRRKVGDVQGQLPPGAGPSQVVDDFGDVWGVFVAIYGPEYEYAQLREVAKLLRKELLLVPDVAKIDFWGDRREAIYVEPNRDRISQLGIDPALIGAALREKNVVADAGRVRVGAEFVAVDPTGGFGTVDDFESLLIRGGEGAQQIYLRDVADVQRGYVEPPDRLLRYDGHVAIGLGISTSSGGNVVRMGEAVEKRVRQILGQVPLGVELGVISLQSQAVVQAIDGFVVSLLQAVAIVVAVLLLFMGLRSGLIIGFVLLATISGTFIFMGPWDVALERISLGALIIALGMLVDNAIVVVDGMLVRIQQGWDAERAASDVVGQTALPLAGATAVAVMAFGAIGLSQDSTGEFTRSLFKVVLISLSLSWVTAVTITPLLGVLFLKPGARQDGEVDPYAGRFYGAYRQFLAACLRHRFVCLGMVLALFGLSLFGFRHVDRSFFPESTRPQFMVDFWLPQGSAIEETIAQAAAAETTLRGLDGVRHVTTLVGAGGMRFLLTYSAEKQNSAYAQFLVDVDDYRRIPALIEEVDRTLPLQHPGAEVYARAFLLGPGGGGKVQARFSGRDPRVLRRLAEQAEAILAADPGAKAVRTDWRERVKAVRPQLAEEEGNAAGITRSDVAAAIRAGFQGQTLGVYRERDELLPIILRAPAPERGDVESLASLQIWSPGAGRMIPLRQVVSGFDTHFEDDIVGRLNRTPTLTVHADPASGPASTLLARVRPPIEAIERPQDYELAWWGEARDSARAQAGIAASIPFFFGAMVLIVIMLFDALRQPLVIWLTVPLASIGVTAGLLLTDQPFGFMALLGFMSLSGMLIKNAIVLIDEIEAVKRAGRTPHDAILLSGVSRLRPVAMAASTTALGLVPLLFDAFFVAMAVTIIFGLVIATVLTMVVVPVLYALVFGVREARAEATAPSAGAARRIPSAGPEDRHLERPRAQS
jgi:multidrug efflux pump subunit AcrB